MTEQKKRRKARTASLSPRAIEVAAAWDVLPRVSQDYVLEIMNSMLRLRREDGPIESMVYARADPKRAHEFERKIERYQERCRKPRRRS